MSLLLVPLTMGTSLLLVPVLWTVRHDRTAQRLAALRQAVERMPSGLDARAERGEGAEMGEPPRSSTHKPQEALVHQAFEVVPDVIGMGGAAAMIERFAAPLRR